LTFLTKHWFKLTGIVAAVIFIVIILQSNINQSKLPILLAAPDFNLEHVDGSKVSLTNTNGKVRLVYFYFSNCPDVCGPTTHIISKVQERLKEKNVFGNKSLLLSITFDPARDTPERLIEFSSAYGADQTGWLFLRGDEKTTMKLSDAYGTPVSKAGEDYIHYNFIYLVDNNGNIRKKYNAAQADVDFREIAEDMEKLM